MFLLDNQVVRTDWRNAKSLVTDLLAKHGGEVTTARRWDERKLAYPIEGRQRGTYLLTYYKLSGDGIIGLRRDLELSETVLRYMLTRVDAVPETEQALHDAELDSSFEIPAPPEDDEPDEVDEPEEEAKPEEAKPEEAKADEADADEGSAAADAEAAPEKAAGEAKTEEPAAPEAVPAAAEAAAEIKAAEIKEGN